MLTRRQTLPLFAAASGLAAQDSGSLYPLIESLANRQGYSHSFLDPRWKSLAEHRSAARKVVLDAFAYAPPPTPLNPQIVERVDLGK